MGHQIDIGISEADRKQIADGLSRLLADTYTLYLKTHNFHWNVKEPGAGKPRARIRSAISSTAVASGFEEVSGRMLHMPTGTEEEE